MNVLDLIISDREQVSLEQVFLEETSRNAIGQLVREHRHVEVLKGYGLPVGNKVMLQGSSGCGKTTTAKAIAHALGKPIFILNLANVISARIGETSQHLKLVFERAGKERAVLFLDEFDQIGKARSVDDRDVGEIRRLVNTIIQLIDYYPSDAMLVCATNHPEIIDPALVRRFQLRLEFSMPSDSVLDSCYDHLLSAFPADLRLIDRKYGISFAEARDHAHRLVKAALLAQLESNSQS